MAIFKNKKKDAAKASTGEVKMSGRLHAVIVRPRITEKAAHLAGDRTYTFTVLPDATKREIALAVRAIYGVTPASVNTAPIRSKQKTRGKLKGRTVTMKKAYVRLAEGETINFV